MTDYGGICTVTTWRALDGSRMEMRVEIADPHVRISKELVDEVVASKHPDVTLTDGVLSIAAVNGTVAYRLRDLVEDEFGGRWYTADLVTPK